MAEHVVKTIPYEQALVSTAILQLELVGQATNLDQDGANADLMAKTALAVSSIEALVAMLFELTIEEVHEDLAQLDPAVIQNAMQNLAIMHAQGR